MEIVKTATEFLISVSVISVILAYPSLVPFILHSLNINFTTFSMQLFSYNIQKSYMFLLCNGILALIVKNSGLVTNSEYESHHNGSQPQKQVVESPVAKKKFDAEVEEEQETESKALVIAAAGESIGLLTHDENEEPENEILVIDEEEEEEEGAGGERIELLSAEELHKKCDDFIRKKKEEIKFEAQQLIIV